MTLSTMLFNIMTPGTMTTNYDIMYDTMITLGMMTLGIISFNTKT
jgi:hypothetical protein